jgi:hypothetical protein
MAAGSFGVLTVRAKRLREAIRHARGLRESLSMNIDESR